jgi:hypothetical protein
MLDVQADFSLDSFDYAQDKFARDMIIENQTEIAF